MECQNCEFEIEGAVTRLTIKGRIYQYCVPCGKVIKNKLEKQKHEIQN